MPHTAASRSPRSGRPPVCPSPIPQAPISAATCASALTSA